MYKKCVSKSIILTRCLGFGDVYYMFCIAIVYAFFYKVKLTQENCATYKCK